MDNPVINTSRYEKTELTALYKEVRHHGIDCPANFCTNSPIPVAFCACAAGTAV